MDVWELIILNTNAVKNQIYCLGPNNAINIGDLVDLIAEKLNWKGLVIWNTKPDRPGEIDILNSSNEKITKELGWYPKVNLSDGLDKTIEFWKNKNKIYL
jgi:UDP-glucose 4-epimerase